MPPHYATVGCLLDDSRLPSTLTTVYQQHGNRSRGLFRGVQQISRLGRNTRTFSSNARQSLRSRRAVLSRMSRTIVNVVPHVRRCA